MRSRRSTRRARATSWASAARPGFGRRGAHPASAGPVATVPPSTGLSPALEETAALQRPLSFGSSGTGLASPALTVLPEATLEGAAATTAVTARRPRRSTLARVRRHPYVRLALNGSFSALWFGQLISLFGDRVNQIALLFFVYQLTNSPLHVALTFVASNLPNLLFSPVAGALVDRWEHKQVLVVSDILRASLVLLVPVAISINVWLAYPIVFFITTVSLFFRPARIAILPRIVQERDLLSANSSMWVGETIADVVNYPLAGLFVLFLGSSVALAFWIDAVTYLASAALLATMVVPPMVRRTRGALDASGEPSKAQPRSPRARRPSPTSARTSRRAGPSSARRQRSSRTRSRARRPSSRWAWSRPSASSSRSR